MVLNLVYKMTKINGDNSVTLHTILLKLRWHYETPTPNMFWALSAHYTKQLHCFIQLCVPDDGPVRCKTCGS